MWTRMRNALKDHRAAVHEQDVLRAMGYPDGALVSEPVRRVCREQLARVGELADPWGSSREVRIESVAGDRVDLGAGRMLRSRRVASMLRRATSVEVCLVTLGGAVSAEVSRLVADGSMIEALALDAAATAATNGLMEELRERVCATAAERRSGTTIPYGPGYTGWRIGDMPVLLSCLDQADVPVRLNEQLMMIPQKSLLCVVGIVPGGKRGRTEVLPCRLCDLDHCSLRRAPYRGAGKPLGCSG